MLKCLRVTQRAASRGTQVAGDERLKRYYTDTRAVSWSLYGWAMSPARPHRMTSVFSPFKWIVHTPPPLCPTISFRSNLGWISFHHLGSTLSCSGSDVTGPCDCSEKKGGFVSGKLVLWWGLQHGDELWLQRDDRLSTVDCMRVFKQTFYLGKSLRAQIS